MRSTPLMLAIALGLGMALPATMLEAAPAATVAEAKAEKTWIVVFEEPAAARFRGFDARDSRRPRLAATSARATGAERYDANSLEARAYVDYLADLRRLRLGEAARRLGRPVEPVYTYSHAIYGVALRLSDADAETVRALPGVASVSPDSLRYLQTDRGPRWIEADEIWSGAATGTPRQGEGVVVGVIDSGLNRSHVSFSGAGISNPRPGFYGYCASTPSACSGKVIGLWDFIAQPQTGLADPVDNNGHGTHVASTAVGVPWVSGGITYSGVAPKANLIAYKACPDATCSSSALIRAIDQATADGVDVINYSIGSDAIDPWVSVGVGGSSDLDQEAFLGAREAGIFIAASAGNDGPDPGTVGGPSNSPWVMSVAAASHDRGGAVNADVLANFSSRGPVVPFGVLKPDVTAPGVDIRAASHTSTTGLAVKSGTSMAAPHVAGAAALLKSTRSGFTADQLVSALTLTARPVVKVDATGTPGHSHEQGAGRIDAALAARAAAYLEVPATAFRNARADRFTGGADELNTPTLTDGGCFVSCTFNRRLKAMPGSPVTSYSVQVNMPASVTLTPSVATITPDADGVPLSFTLNVDNPSLVGTWVRGDVTLVNTSGNGTPNLRFPVTAFVAPFASEAAWPDEQQIDVESDRGYFELSLADAVRMPSARFVATNLVPLKVVTTNIAADATPGDAYNSPGTNYVDLVTVPATASPTQYTIRVTTSAGNPDIDLFVGRDTNGDGLPSASEEVCSSTSTGSAEICEVRVNSGASPVNYWIMVQNYSGPGSNVRIESVAFSPAPGTDGKLAATGPGRVDQGVPFKVRVGYDDPGFLPGETRLAYVYLQPVAGTNAAWVPVRLRRTGSTVAPYALANGVSRDVTLAAGAAQDKLYFDVPPHATSVRFTTASTGNLDLYVARVDNTAYSASSVIAAAPARGAANASATTSGGNETITLTGLQPGRWYVTPVNPTGAVVSGTVKAEVLAAGARPGFRSGHYYNPLRSGHGAFIDFSGPIGAPTRWVMVWYTYLEDGTPTWYYSEEVAPGASGIWRAPLFRVVWDGSSTHATRVGDISLTEVGAESVSFSFNLDGTSGSESFARLTGATSGCSQYNGQPLDVSGHWYSPSLSGFGYSYQVTAGANAQEIFIPYIYDGSGNPRWVYSQRALDTGSSTLPLTWFSGFCPTCAPVSLVGTSAGTGSRVLATDDVTSMGAVVNFTGALSGSWSQTRDVDLLSQRKSCQ